MNIKVTLNYDSVWMNFLGGAGDIINIWGTPSKSLSFKISDNDIYYDWQAIGSDIENSIFNFKQKALSGKEKR